MLNLYDCIGGSYANRRQQDPQILSRLRRCLRGADSIVNVGAGAGSYEPVDLRVVAVEPSMRMIHQRRDLSNVVQGAAEALPFRDRSFGAATAILTVHHWRDKGRGLKECARVARDRVIMLTWDPASDGFWLVQDYLPELLAFDKRIFPSMVDIEKALGPIAVETLPIRGDCVDGFLGAYWRRPGAYLDKGIRGGMSSFARIADAGERLEELRKDLMSGKWERRYRRLLSVDEYDIGYRLVTADLS